MNRRKYLAFDIEIAKEIPAGETDWNKHRPLGISCAATLIESQYPTLWHSPPHPAPQLSRHEAQELVSFLAFLNRTTNPYTIIGWNSAGFDFLTLAEESRWWEQCRNLVLNHVDMMFQIFCLRGHTLGLDKAAKGMGLKGKTQGMDGSLAPRLWLAGQHQKVLDYVAQDVITTLELARAIEEAGYIEWISNSGHRIRQEIDRWLTVQECLELPEPDTSWMTDPWPREKFTAWLNL